MQEPSTLPSDYAQSKPPVKGFSRTSDIVGAHFKKDLDAYLTLIRRKIQEKVGTTQDLIQQIRRNKIGDSGLVTPNEFRYTLIKFGVILPQPLVDRIFNVFDSDRSGTMDFDEFAMWIMNAEFRPPFEVTETPEEAKVRITTARNDVLRGKLNKCISLYGPVFKTMKRTISFTEWVSLVNRGSMPITEREARAIFLLFDPNDTGFMASAHLMQWSKTGDLTPPPPSAGSRNALALDDISLEEAIKKVAGKNLLMVEKSFIHLPQNEGVRIPFEEFRRCLLGNGLGRNILETRQLFNALGGKGHVGTCQIDELMRAVSNRGPENPQQMVSMKKERGQVANLNAADRRLREALRKCFGEFKGACIAADKSGSGYISAQDLHKQVLNICGAMSFQDFRYIVQNIHGTDNGGRIHIHHFLESYDPRNAPHQLAGGLGVIHDAAGKTVLNSPVSTLRGTGSAGAMGGSKSDGNFFGNASKKGLSINDDMRAVDPSGDLRRIWQGVLRECHRQDPDRSGCVNRMAFINALELSNAGNVMPAKTMAQLADKYDAGFGLVNYLACFRTYLTAMTSQNIAVVKEAPKDLARASTEVRENRAHHPWEFSYKKQPKHGAAPYWKDATVAPKDVNLLAAPEVNVPNSIDRGAHQLTAQEKDALLSKYNELVLKSCKKIYKDMGDGGPQWKELRNEMKRGQINSQRGSILTTNWYALCEKYNIKLGIAGSNAVTRAFRGLGNQDVIKYNDLVRVCTLVGSTP